MRISRPWLAVLCLIAPICLGCQSGGGSLAMKDLWPWGKKNAQTESSVAGGTKYPQTPAQMAQPDVSLAGQGYGSQAYGVPGASPQANPYGQTAQPGGYANSPTNYQPATGAPGEYGAGLYDSTQPAGYAGYPATPQAAPQTAPAGGAALQNQYYNPEYARAGGVESQPTAYPPAQTTPPGVASYQEYNGMTAQAPGYQGAPAETMNPYAAAPAYQTADARNGTAPPYAATAPPAQAYAPPQTTMPPSAYNPAPTTTVAPSGYTSDPTGFQPGQTGYAPGNTGYAPPNAQPYNSPGGNYQMPTVPGRSDAPYRPGNTGNYRGAAKIKTTTDVADSGLSVVAPASYEATAEGLTPETAPLYQAPAASIDSAPATPANPVVTP